MRIKIENPIERDFGMVPRALWKMPLPFAAKGLLAYLFCLRDGAVPYVAEIEAECGIGRDARRKAFAALEAAGAIEWRVETDGGRIVGKTLVLHPSACRAPENQADGETINAPENPAGGISVPSGVENRPRTACGSGDTLKNKIDRAASARSAVRKGRSAPLVAAGLSSFQRSRVLSGQSVLLDGVTLQAGSPQAVALRMALRSDCLEKGAGHV